MGNGFEEADCNHCFFLVILNRDYRGLGVQGAVFGFDEHAIGKFQRTIHGKKNFARRAEFDDSVLNKDGSVVVGAVDAMAILVDLAELDGNPHGSGFGKEPGQAAYDVLFERWSSCLVGHG